jgi:hypothetical protein
MQALFDGTVLRLACVNRDWAGQAAGPAMSAMPRKRRLARKRRPVVMGQERPLAMQQNSRDPMARDRLGKLKWG